MHCIVSQRCHSILNFHWCPFRSADFFNQNYFSGSSLFDSFLLVLYSLSSPFSVHLYFCIALLSSFPSALPSAPSRRPTLSSAVRHWYSSVYLLSFFSSGCHVSTFRAFSAPCGRGLRNFRRTRLAGMRRCRCFLFYTRFAGLDYSRPRHCATYKSRVLNATSQKTSRVS